MVPDLTTQKLLALGSLLIFVGVVLMILGSVGQGTTSTGGFILIGPVPIVFGSGSNGGVLALLSVVLGLVMVASLFLLLRRKRVPNP